VPSREPSFDARHAPQEPHCGFSSRHPADGLAIDATEGDVRSLATSRREIVTTARCRSTLGDTPSCLLSCRPAPRPSLGPTRRWWAAQVTATAGLIVLIIKYGWRTSQEVAVVTAVAAASGAYLVLNQSTRGGVPLSKHPTGV
jgi:hypothetical protein